MTFDMSFNPIGDEAMIINPDVESSEQSSNFVEISATKGSGHLKGKMGKPNKGCPASQLFPSRAAATQHMVIASRSIGDTHAANQRKASDSHVTYKSRESQTQSDLNNIWNDIERTRIVSQLISRPNQSSFPSPSTTLATAGAVLGMVTGPKVEPFLAERAHVAAHRNFAAISSSLEYANGIHNMRLADLEAAKNLPKFDAPLKKDGNVININRAQQSRAVHQSNLEQLNRSAQQMGVAKDAIQQKMHRSAEKVINSAVRVSRPPTSVRGFVTTAVVIAVQTGAGFLLGKAIESTSNANKEASSQTDASIDIAKQTE